jgi:hypothetical protein
VKVSGKADQIDPAAVGHEMAAGGVELAPEGPGASERIAGQGGVETPDGDGGLSSAVTISPETNRSAIAPPAPACHHSQTFP